MGVKLLWTGLTFITALGVALEQFGLQASKDIIIVGAILMIIGMILMWFDK